MIMAIAFGLLSGCAGHEVAQVGRENTISALNVGDEVEISQYDGTYVAFIISAIEDDELIGESVRVSIADIEAINVYVKDDPSLVSDSREKNRNWEDHFTDAMVVLQAIIYMAAILASL